MSFLFSFSTDVHHWRKKVNNTANNDTDANDDSADDGNYDNNNVNNNDNKQPQQTTTWQTLKITRFVRRKLFLPLSLPSLSSSKEIRNKM